jgi:predicted GIY-YIG superfamily endonuclease
MAQPWYCYIARCHDNSLYVGIAQNLEERMRRHNSGAGADFTARRRPVELIWSERFVDSEKARRREKEIKGWSKEKKLRLVATPGLAAKAEHSQAVRVNTASDVGRSGLGE